MFVPLPGQPASKHACPVLIYVFQLLVAPFTAAATVAAAARGTAYLPTAGIAFVHLLSYAVWLGAIVWTTFIAGGYVGQSRGGGLSAGCRRPCANSAETVHCHRMFPSGGNMVPRTHPPPPPPHHLNY
jgi:hypothetical protein